MFSKGVKSLMMDIVLVITVWWVEVKEGRTQDLDGAGYSLCYVIYKTRYSGGGVKLTVHVSVVAGEQDGGVMETKEWEIWFP